jgi:hypothetical protein
MGSTSGKPAMIAQNRAERRGPAVPATSAYYFKPKSTRVVAPLSLMP